MRDLRQALNRSYPYIAGNTWAHELAADGMLVNFRESFFEPYKGYYTEEAYNKLTEFYTAHKDESVEGGDVELQHERMARAAERACSENIRNIPKMREGGLEFLERQSVLWKKPSKQQSIKAFQFPRNQIIYQVVLLLNLKLGELLILSKNPCRYQYKGHL